MSLNNHFKHVKKQVFFPASGFILVLLGFAAFLPEKTDALFNQLQQFVLHYFSWFYVLSVAIYLLVIAYVAISRNGDIRLGPDHCKPDYSYLSWFAMLFSAGMGIGIVFFGVAEPVMHFIHPPEGKAETVLAARQAMEITFFHWGLHAWAVYAVVALNLAYFSYRHDRELSIRSALYPIIGERVKGFWGDAVDVFAILSTIFGVATSLGYGVLQINAGLEYLFQIPQTVFVQASLIFIVTIIATLSVAAGLDKGIKFLSELNLVMALCLLALVFCFGPTLFLLSTFVQNTGSYLSDLINKTFNLYAYAPTEWIGGWTLFYWGWWIAWSPFVGMFIAKISRGRTIREFIVGVLLVPTGLTFAWMTIFGDSAIHFILFDGVKSLGEQVNDNKALAIFQFLELFPFKRVLSLLVIAIVAIFFITSADSGALVVDALATSNHKRAPLWQRLFWALMIGLVATVLLLAGGLKALQTATIASAFPFAIILLVACFGLLKSLSIERAKKISMLHPMNTTTVLAGDKSGWKGRVNNLLSCPEQDKVCQFISGVVREAFALIQAEFKVKQLNVEIVSNVDEIAFLVKHGEQTDFIYCVKVRALDTPHYKGGKCLEGVQPHKYYRAEVFLREGGQQYDLMGCSKEQVIHDLLDQYEKHVHFLQSIR